MIDSSSRRDAGPQTLGATSDEAKGIAKNWALEHLEKTRTIEIFGGINNAVARRVIDQLLYLEGVDDERPILVVMNSPGGSVTDGFAIYDTMRFVKPEVQILCVGLAASIATVILLGAPKEQRLTLPHTEFLIHQPLIAGNVFGVASDLEITARQILNTRDRINRLLSDETGQPLEVVEKHTQRDYWMRAEDAVEYGLVARIVNHRGEI